MSGEPDNLKFTFRVNPGDGITYSNIEGQVRKYFEEKGYLPSQIAAEFSTLQVVSDSPIYNHEEDSVLLVGLKLRCKINQDLEPGQFELRDHSFRVELDAPPANMFKHSYKL